MEHLFLTQFQRVHWLQQQPMGLVANAHTVRDLFSEARAASFDGRALLSPAQSMVAWAGVVSKVMQERWSHNLLPSARAMREAYSICQLNNIAPEAGSLLEDGFAAFQETCEKRGVVAWEDAILSIAPDVFSGREFCVHGDILTPVEKAALEQAGAVLHQCEAGAQLSTPALHLTPSPAITQHHVARRCLELAQASNGQARIAVVHDGDPDTVSSLEDVLRTELVPDTLTGQRNYWDVPWRHASPPSLVETPWVDLACAVFELDAGWNSMLDVSRLLLDRGILPPSELAARADVEWKLRNDGGSFVSLGRVTEMLRSRGADMAADAFAKIADGELSGTRTFVEWAKSFNELLRDFGWMCHLEDDGFVGQFQTLWEGVLYEFGAMDAVMGECGKARAVAWLREVCRTVRWQPDTEHHQPIVLATPSALEGAEFDHVIWLDGSSKNVPSKKVSNAFLNTAAISDELDAYLSPEAMLEKAEAQIEACCTAKTFDVYVAAHDVQGVMQIPSTLFGSWADADMLDLDNDVTVEREALAEPDAPVADERLTLLRGGTSLLTNAAVSPFYAAMRNRFHVKSLEPTRGGITHRLQGSLVHRVLELFWQETQTSEALGELSEKDQKARIDNCITHAFCTDGLLPEDRYGRFLVDCERARIAALVNNWLEHERQREYPFEVHGLEVELEINIKGYTPKVKIDRIDRITLPDGDVRYCVVDYKTGSNISVTGWDVGALTDPQLPSYAAFAGDVLGIPVDGIAFAHVNRAPAFSMQTNFAGRMVFDRKGTLGHPVQDWNGRVAAWKDACEALVDSVVVGNFEVLSNSKVPTYLNDLFWFTRNDID